MKRPVGNRVEITIAIIFLAAWVAGTVTGVVVYSNMDSTWQYVKLQGDLERFGVEHFLSKLETIGNTSLTLVGALWAGFFLSERSTTNIYSLATVLLFAGTNLFLLSSYVCYFLGDQLLTSRLFFRGTFDLGAESVLFWANSQTLYFAAGVACAAATLVCARRHP
jgi:hypothetical protein